MLRPALAGLALAAATLVIPGTATAKPAPAPVVVADVTLAAVPLKDLQPSIQDDRGVKLGGVGSGLFPAGRDGEFWMVTDRGPNGQPTVGGEKRRTFPIPEFAPAIAKVSTRHGVEVKKWIPLTGRSGKPITGMSNQAGHDELPYTWDGLTKLAYNPSGVDTEDVVVDRHGDFWLVDEYSPSLIHVSPKGRVIARYVPQGLNLTGADYPVKDVLPAILATRPQNRGFEGLAINGGTLYLAVQSPLQNPAKAVGDKSRVARILTFDIRRGRITGEYAYQFEDVNVFDPSYDGDQSQMKISGLAHVAGDRILVDERTDRVAHIYEINLAKAKNLLGGRYDDASTTPSLEALTDLTQVRPAPKTLIADLSKVAPTLPGKVEGLAILDPRTIAVANDNDFGLGEFGADGRLIDSGVKSRIVTIRLPKPLD
ncbi:esterase-like activity of phytase family protein [Herbidospora cretacea]|uniref:esterase-like activity of phytase family protein n=1 Tax=Herbidospora cretacea TaxID=28444 RepID=UPI0007732A61|nr:esterase-like activity of phytase family protein [Herbidospora cretacea]